MPRGRQSLRQASPLQYRQLDQQACWIRHFRRSRVPLKAGPRRDAMKNDRPLGIKEIAHQLGCSTRTIRRYHAEGKISTYKVGAKTSPIKIRQADLTKFIRKRGSEES
ncbi:DNA-binding protein [Sinorhizobium meliloti]|nr:DNA-binding protein [Sinorhizobium meliloti]MQW26667.1 helix-turn-helix domain-containing protein [Sinorhizobium meliloti]